MSELNKWFMSLPEERQQILREDKWMLANAAYQTATEAMQANAVVNRREQMQREQRYIVFKNRDIEKYLTESEKEQLNGICLKISHSRLHDGKEILNGVFVEQDWPECEKVWAMIEARVDGV